MRKHRLTICYFGFRRWQRPQQSVKGFFGKQGTPHNAHYIVDASFDFHFVLYDCHYTIGTDGCIYLYAHRSLRVAPEGIDAEMLLNPFEEKLHLPSVLIQEYNLFSREIEIVCVESKRPAQIRNVCHYSTDAVRVVSLIPFASESDSLIHQDVAIVKEIAAILHLVIRPLFLTYDKERAESLNLVKPLQIPISAIKYITGAGFIFNDIHCIDIVNSSICNVDHCRNLCNNVQLRMEFDTRFGTPELRPIENTHAEVYCGRIKREELTSNAELSIDTRLLRKCDHVVGERFKDMPVPIGIASGKNRSVHFGFTEPEVKRFIPMSRSDIGQFSQASTSEKLPEHEDEQLSPVRQLPTRSRVRGIPLGSCSHDSLEISFWQKVNDLAEYVSPCIHQNFGIQILRLRPQYNDSKSATRFSALKIA